MSDTIDDQLRRAFDALAERVRAAVSDQVSVTVEQLSASVESAKKAAALSAATEAAAAAERTVTARLTETFERREEQIKEATRAEWFEAGLQQARSEALAVQAARDAETQAAIDAASKATADASAAAAASVAAAEAAAANAAAMAAVANAVHRSAFERLLQSVQTLDATRSLTQSLDALFTSARSDAQRVALFLLRGDVLRAWSHAGFEVLAQDSAVDLPLAEAGAAAAAVRTGSTQRVDPGMDGRPEFAREPGSNAFVAVPLTMNGQVIAVLCGEQTHTDETVEWLASAWEILARHTARVLESLTALRLAQAGSQPPALMPAMPSQ